MFWILLCFSTWCCIADSYKMVNVFVVRNKPWKICMFIYMKMIRDVVIHL